MIKVIDLTIVVLISPFSTRFLFYKHQEYMYSYISNNCLVLSLFVLYNFFIKYKIRCGQKITGLVFCGTNDPSLKVKRHIAELSDIPLHIPAGWTTLGCSIGLQPSFLLECVSAACWENGRCFNPLHASKIWLTCIQNFVTNRDFAKVYILFFLGP